MILTWGHSHRPSLDPEVRDPSLETETEVHSSFFGSGTSTSPPRLTRSYLHPPLGRPRSHHPTVNYAQPRPISTTMSRATNRPTHIPLPNSPFNGRSPNGSPLPTPAAVSPTSPRSSFIPSFIRTRSRAATLTGGGRGRSSPSAEVANPIGPSVSHRSTSTNAGVTRSVSSPQSGGLAEAAMAPLSVAQSNPNSTAAIIAAQPPRDPSSPPKTFRIRLVPHLETSRSLAFDPVVREVMPIVVPPGINPSAVAASITDVGDALNGRPPALILKIGRFTEKPGQAAAAAAQAAATAAAQASSSGAGGSSAIGSGPMSATITIAGGGGDICATRVAFKSKVVSRSHAEIWCEPEGKFFIRDTSSSSGTFLNHIRLSSPNTDSRPTQINDGDVLQLGVDYQGGHEDMYRCVKMRVELGREWQRGANEFNTNALRQLKALGGAPATPEGKGKQAENVSGPPASGGRKKASVTDCCICLFSVTVCQSLFIAPCSHVFHYKCIRPLLQQHHPGFSCPLCRTFANLDEDVETEDAWELASRRASVLSRKASNHSIRIPSSDALGEMDPLEQEAGTGVNLGGGAASVEDLLSQPNGHDQAQSDNIESLSLHDRQSTILPAPTTPENPLAPEETAAIPISAQAGGNGNTFATSFSQAATPMNDTFLSTLAPSVHQRLDLADQLDTSSQGHGSGVPETLMEESDSVLDESAEGSGSASASASGGPNTRRGSGPDEMVFELAG